MLLALGVLGAGSVFLFQYLTFIPDYSSAEEITTPIVGEERDDDRTLSQITYMQEMTTGICNRSEEHETKQLIDTRDGKKYWVAKLKDGNCWMTQNLDLDLVGRTLTPYDSDVKTNWVSTTGPSTMIGYNNTDYHKAKYYDAGEYVYTNPTTSKNCNAGLAGLGGGTCATDGWVNVNGMTASSDPNFGTSVINNVYNAHYLAGNRYSWAAATVKSGNTLTTNNTDATSSICPKGWTLPKSGRYSGGMPFNTNTTFAKLFESYGWRWNAYDESFKYYYSNSINGGTSYDLRVAPFYFLHGGGVYNGSLLNAGNQGRYWSSTASSVANAYGLYFGFTNVNPSNDTNRYFGDSVRCVARDNVPDVKLPEIDNPNVSVMVDRVLTLEITDEEVNTEPEYSKIATGNFTATVSSNAGYDISLSATEDGHTAMIDNKSATFNIPATNNVEVGTNGWGIKCVDDENCILKSYNALTLYNNPQIYFSSTNPAANKPTKFEVGIGISPSLPSGTYSTNILVTASQKQ